MAFFKGKYLKIIIIALLPALFVQCSFSQASKKEAKITNMTTDNMENSDKKHKTYSRTDTAKVNLSEEEWKEILPHDIYYIARMKGTERPWSSKFEEFYEAGTYYCAACGNPLFKSDTKFDSGCGWPSFYQPISRSSIIYTPDHTHGMERTEVQCGRCKAHLGHVFEDGPKPTGLRYCINGVILDFAKAEEAEKKYNEGKKE